MEEELEFFTQYVFVIVIDHLNEILVEDLDRVRAEVEGTTPIYRLTAAIASKDGVAQTEHAEWYDVQWRTIHTWLKRLGQSRLSQPSATIIEVVVHESSATTS